MTGKSAETPDEDQGPDLEGCQNETHCHRARSARQETAYTETGSRRACHKPMGWGTQHPGIGACKLHGGASPWANVSAERERASAAVVTMGLPVDVSPSQALLDEVKRAAGAVSWLTTVLQRMDPSELAWGVHEETVEPDIQDLDKATITASIVAKWSARPNIWYTMWMENRKQLVYAAKEAIAAGVSERMVHMYETVYSEVGDVYIGLIDRVLDRLNLTAEQRAAVGPAMVTELQVITEEVVNEQ